MSIEIRTVIEMIASNEWTAVVVRDDSSIADVIGFDAIPSGERISGITKDNPGCASQFVPRGVLDEEQVKSIVQGLVDALVYSRTHKLRPGVNIPNK